MHKNSAVNTEAVKRIDFISPDSSFHTKKSLGSYSEKLLAREHYI
jgi:hypothetical protein